MPILSITKTYQDGDILTEADLDNIRTSIENFINTTGIASDNIQPGGVAVTDIGINDNDFLTFGTGDDGQIGVTSDDLIIKNVTTDKDIIFQVNDGGVPSTEVARFNADVPEFLMAAGKHINMNTTGKVINLAAPSAGTDATNKTYVDSGNAAVTAQTLSTAVSISDVKATGIAGGDPSLTGVFVTRVLNTLSNPSAVTWVSLAANQITISQAGTYLITGYGIALAAQGHKVKLRNVTDSTDAIIGSSGVTPNTSAENTYSHLSGILILSASKVFELQHHIAASASAGQSFGSASSSGVSEIYANVTIVRLSS